MNNKGFTLVEVVVVIAIVAIMASIFTINMTKVLQTVNSSEKDRLLSDVELATDAYINSSKILLKSISDCNFKTIIYTRDLLDSGYLKQSGDITYPTSISVCVDSNGVLHFS